MVYERNVAKSCDITGFNWHPVQDFDLCGDNSKRDTQVGQIFDSSLGHNGPYPFQHGNPRHIAPSFHSFVKTGRKSSYVSELLKNEDNMFDSASTWSDTKQFTKTSNSAFCFDRLKLVIGPHLSTFSESPSSKIESLFKILVQSLHLVIRTVCLRKRRRDRECLPQDQEDKPYLDETVLEKNNFDTDLLQLVDLAPGLGYEEWLASHTIDFFHHVNLLYGTVCEFCTLTTCPDMTGPCMRQYLWFDEKGKKTRVAASQYIDYVMTFTQNTVNDEAIFPTKFDSEFPVSFESIVKKIHRLLFHVLAHIYHSHFREMRRLGLHTHVNCVFAHLILFSDKFKLIEEKETEILKDLVEALKIFPVDLILSTELNRSTETNSTTDGPLPTPDMDMQVDEPETTITSLPPTMTLVAKVETTTIKAPGYPMLVSPSKESIDTRP